MLSSRAAVLWTKVRVDPTYPDAVVSGLGNNQENSFAFMQVMLNQHEGNKCLPEAYAITDQRTTPLICNLQSAVITISLVATQVVVNNGAGLFPSFLGLLSPL